MALEPAEVQPQTRKKKQGMADEIRETGTPGMWYLIAQYDKYATARDGASKLRLRNPDLEFTADKGALYGRNPK